MHYEKSKKYLVFCVCQEGLSVEMCGTMNKML